MAISKITGSGLGAITQDGAATFNEGSADVDFRVESNGNTHMLFVDGGNDRVGVGTNSPAVSFHINSGGTNTVAKFESTDVGAFIVIEDGQGTANGNTISVNTNTMAFATADAPRMTIGSGGDIDVETGDIFFSTAGKGIVLGATSNTDANTLDDYEEGSWTPSVGGNAGYSSQVGKYTKVGNMVTVWCNQYLGAIGTGSTGTISGLPFTVSNIAEFNVNGNGVAYLVSSALSFASCTAYLPKNTTTVKFATVAAGGATSFVADKAVLGNNTDLYFTVTYRTG
jgi:hypothetical protein